MNVKFASDGKHLISVGGSDRSIFQWKYTINNEANNEDEVNLENEAAIIDDSSFPIETDPIKLGTREKREVEPGLLEIQEIKRMDEYLANKPYQAEVLHSTPSSYKEPKEPVIFGSYYREIFPKRIYQLDMFTDTDRLILEIT